MPPRTFAIGPKKVHPIAKPPGTIFGIFSMDPGSTTGLAYTKKPIQPNTRPKDAFAGSGLEVLQVNEGDEMASAVLIAGLYISWRDKMAQAGVPIEHITFVYEDFILRAGKEHSSARSGLSPVRITALVQGLLYNGRPNYVAQSPADAKGRWTNERLRRAEMWTVGKEHGRDATRHAALYYARHLC